MDRSFVYIQLTGEVEESFHLWNKLLLEGLHIEGIAFIGVMGDIGHLVVGPQSHHFLKLRFHL